MSKRGDATPEHPYHRRIADDANQLNEDDLDSTQVQHLRMMYKQGVPNSSKAGVMSEKCEKLVRIIVGANAVRKNLLRQLVDVRTGRVLSQPKPVVR